MAVAVSTFVPGYRGGGRAGIVAPVWKSHAPASLFACRERGGMLRSRHEPSASAATSLVRVDAKVAWEVARTRDEGNVSARVTANGAQ